MVADARVPPVVIPFYHRGLHNLLKKGETIPVALKQPIDILVGEPIDFSETLARMRAARVPERDIHVAVSERIGVELAALRKRLEQKVGPEIPVAAPNAR